MQSIRQSGKFAKEFCEDHRIEFKVVTEKELGIR